jgi:hypothetical protein
MSVQIQFRRGTAASWASANPVLAQGELGLETDSLAYKIGDGVTPWNALGYPQLSGEFASMLLEAFGASSEPTTPASGMLQLYAKNVAGRLMPKFVGPSGLDSQIQPAFYGNGVICLLPASSTAFSAIGTATFTAVGTVSHPAPAAGSLRASTSRANVISAATANSVSELRVAVAQTWRGDAPGLGGFFAVFRFGSSTSVAGQRFIVGLTGSTAAIATTQSPSALTSCVFIGNDAADANLFVMHNDGSGTCTKINLGASFPIPTNVNNALYELTLFAAPNAATIGWRVVRLDDGSVASGTISADLPPSTTFLAPHLYVNNNGVASAVGLDFFRFYRESDY